MTAAHYTGGCHCGAVRFRFHTDAPITGGLRCNCSICRRRGAVMSLPWFPPDAFDELVGMDALTIYQWGDHDMNHYFCKTCGVAPFSEVVEKPGHLRLNLGCVEEVDPLAVSIELIDGRAFPVRGRPST